MIIYSPLDGEALTSAIPSRPRHCFLMTRLGGDIPDDVQAMREAVTELCLRAEYRVIDARSQITGRDFLMKIWRLIASTPLSVGVCHEQIPPSTQMNIYYEIGVAQALGKETLIVKSPTAAVPSDFVRTELAFDDDFERGVRTVPGFVAGASRSLRKGGRSAGEDPVLALDYLKRAFLTPAMSDFAPRLRP